MELKSFRYQIGQHNNVLFQILHILVSSFTQRLLEPRQWNWQEILQQLDWWIAEE